MEKVSRREILKMSVVPAAAAALGLTPMSAVTGDHEKPVKKLKIVVVGAHPDDPETTSGGTMLVLSGEGHEVISAYLTRGEAGIPGKSYEEAASIRTAEALKACEILNARAEFIGQIDGNCEITPKRYTEMTDFLEKEKPDVVITHWPVDAHRDHRICSILVYDAWINLNRGFDLYYFEAESGGQTQNFPPTHFVDITSVLEKKHIACYCHVSQEMEKIYSEYHELMEKFRGMQANCKFAEAFIKHNQSFGKTI